MPVNSYLTSRFPFNGHLHDNLRIADYLASNLSVIGNVTFNFPNKS